MIGPERMYTAVSPSPDGRYFLVAYLTKPFSYAVPCGRFPKRVELWDRFVHACMGIIRTLSFIAKNS